MDNLLKKIKEKGYSIEGFSNKILRMQYRNFKYTLDNDVFRERDILLILKALDCDFDDLYIDRKNYVAKIPASTKTPKEGISKPGSKEDDFIEV